MVEKLDQNTRKNTLVTGYAGTGKTTRVIIPKLEECKSSGKSVIVNDPRGELYDTTAQWFKEKGYVVRKFDLKNPDDSDSWTCLRDLFTREGALDEKRVSFFAEKIVTSTCPIGKEDRNACITRAMTALLMAGIVHIAGETAAGFAQKQDQSINQLIELFREDKSLEEFAAEIENGKNTKAIGYLAKLDAYQDDMKSYLFVTVCKALSLYKVFAKITGKDEIDLSLPAREKAVYFIKAPDTHDCPLANIFIQMAYAKLAEEADTSRTGKCEVPVAVVLDEFPLLGRIKYFPQLLNVMRARGICTTIVVQDTDQLYTLYGNEAGTTIIAACEEIIDTNIESVSRHLNETVKVEGDPIFEVAEDALLKALLYASRIYGNQSLTASFANHLLLKEASDILGRALNMHSPEDFLAGYIAENMEAERHFVLYQRSSSNLRTRFIRGLKERLDKYLDE